jgi:hypothetical protein
MLFANPVFLIALTALGIPVIIHLYNFRRYKKIYFTNVRFIAEIKQESKNRSQLKHLLILLMRLLAITCLVIAFAQPYLPSQLQQKNLAGRQAVSVYLDNSFSMEALATNGKLLEIAKTKALEIASAYKPSDIFQLLTADFEGRHQRFVSIEEFRNSVEEVTISPVFRSLSDVIRRQEDLLTQNRGSNRSAYIISDFQKSSSNLENLKTDSSVSYFFVPVVAEKTNNLYIDTAWFDAPSQQAGQAVKLNVKIRNSSEDMLEKIPVRLVVNKIQKAVSSFSIDPSGTTIVTLPFTNNIQGIQYGTLEITDYPVIWDDKFYFSYPISSTIPLLCINGDKNNPFLDALFENDSTIQIKNVSINQLDYSSFVRFPLILLNGIEELSSGLSEELAKFIRQGGDILVFPSVKINTESYTSFLGALGLPSYSGLDTTKQVVSELNIQGEIFKDVFEKDASGKMVLPDNADMPVVSRHYVIRESSKSGLEDILKMQNGNHFLCVSKVDKGRFYLCSVPLDDKWSNFPMHTIFVPAIYRIALLSEASPQFYHYVGSNDPIEILNDSIPAKEVYKIRKIDTYYEFIPETRSTGGHLLLFPHDQVKEAGHYQISEGTRVVQGIAFNYDRHESELDCFSADDLRKGLKQIGVKYFAVIQAKKNPLTQQVIEMSQGTPLWKIFIILTLLFIAGEIILIRLMKD